jgi:pimeloyl-ACP methyl ester carboxylesterase
MDAMKAESVELNDIEMYYETEGTGEPLLLLHGGTGCQEDWIYAGGDQFAHEYTIIKPDASGHGRTSNPHKRLHTGSVRWTLSPCWIVSGSVSAGRSD